MSSRSALSALVMTVLVAFNPWAATAGPEDEVEQAEQKRSQALLNGDVAALDALYADEFFYNQASGNSVAKSAYLPQFASGDIKVRKLVREGAKVRVYGDTAVVTAMQHIDVTLKGEDRTVHLRYLHVWVKTGGAWKLVARQATNLPAQN